MLKVALVGLGKMGLSHLSIICTHPDVDIVGVCDSSGLVLDVLAKQSGLKTYTNYERMLSEGKPDAVIIVTPSHLHASMARSALMADAHVFCEKPLFLDPNEGAKITALARQRGLVTQVGYHNRFVGTFAEAKKLIDCGAIGEVTTALAEAYGPVVVKPAGLDWRSTKAAGGGCLYDYAAHPVDLLTWYLGPVRSARGSSLRTVFSREVDDQVSATLDFASGATGTLNVNWSDSSHRKMSTAITLWGTRGRVRVDRQEIQVFLTPEATPPPGYSHGWNVLYTTELSQPPRFYVRGEEYSAQLDAFVERALAGDTDGISTFESAGLTDTALALIQIDADRAAIEAISNDALSSLPRSRPRSSGAAPSARAAARRVIGGTRRAARWVRPRAASAAASAARRLKGAKK